MLVLFRDAFTRPRSRVRLGDFRTTTVAFLPRLRMDGVAHGEDWTGRTLAEDWVAWERTRPGPDQRR